MTSPLHRVLVTETYEPRARRVNSQTTLFEAARRLFGPMGAPEIAAADVALDHTPLGQPIVTLHGALERWARDRAIHAHDLHLSFSHDGEALVALLATAPGLRGTGVDLVYLPRLARCSEAHLLGLARQFMSAEEYATFAREVRHEEYSAIVERVASHFSLMEAASKALGTGLKLGFGNGTRHSLLPREIAVAALTPEVAFDFGLAARARCEAIGAHRAEGHVTRDGEYLRSEVYLWGAGGGL